KIRAGLEERQVGAVRQVGVRLSAGRAAMELRDDVEHERPADAVEGEPLPELRHEQHPQRRGMPEELVERWNRGFNSRRRRNTAHAAPPETSATSSGRVQVGIQLS